MSRRRDYLRPSLTRRFGTFKNIDFYSDPQGHWYVRSKLPQEVHPIQLLVERGLMENHEAVLEFLKGLEALKR